MKPKIRQANFWFDTIGFAILMAHIFMAFYGVYYKILPDFLLVIFFMVGSKFSEAESRIKVSVPSVGQLKSISRVPDERIVVVAPDGTITLDGSPMTLEDLRATLTQQLQSYPSSQGHLE